MFPTISNTLPTAILATIHSVRSILLNCMCCVVDEVEIALFRQCNDASSTHRVRRGGIGGCIPSDCPKVVYLVAIAVMKRYVVRL